MFIVNSSFELNYSDASLNPSTDVNSLVHIQGVVNSIQSSTLYLEGFDHIAFASRTSTTFANMGIDVGTTISFYDYFCAYSQVYEYRYYPNSVEIVAPAG